MIPLKSRKGLDFFHINLQIHHYHFLSHLAFASDNNELLYPVPGSNIQQDRALQYSI